VALIAQYDNTPFWIPGLNDLEWPIHLNVAAADEDNDDDDIDDDGRRRRRRP